MIMHHVLAVRHTIARFIVVRGITRVFDQHVCLTVLGHQKNCALYITPTTHAAMTLTVTGDNVRTRSHHWGWLRSFQVATATPTSLTAVSAASALRPRLPTPHDTAAAWAMLATAWAACVLQEGEQSRELEAATTTAAAAAAAVRKDTAAAAAAVCKDTTAAAAAALPAPSAGSEDQPSSSLKELLQELSAAHRKGSEEQLAHVQLSVATALDALCGSTVAVLGRALQAAAGSHGGSDCTVAAAAAAGGGDAADAAAAANDATGQDDGAAASASVVTEQQQQQQQQIAAVEGLLQPAYDVNQKTGMGAAKLAGVVAAAADTLCVS
jgi:hypothetical protein